MAAKNDERSEEEQLLDDDGDASGKRRRVQRACDVSASDTKQASGFLTCYVCNADRSAGRKRFAAMASNRKRVLAPIGELRSEWWCAVPT